MSLLGISILVGLFAGGILAGIIIKGGKFHLLPSAIVVGLCAGLLTHMVTYQANGMNSTSLSHWDDYNTIILWDYTDDGIFGDRYEYRVVYGDDKYEVVINYDDGGEYEHKDIDIFIKDYWGELVYSLWGSRVDNDDWLQMKRIFVDKFSEAEYKRFLEDGEPIVKHIKN